MKKLIPVILVSILFSKLSAQEFVQWRGDNRDGKYNETGLLKQWPEAGPTLLWHYDDLGNGHTSAVVTKSGIFASGMVGDKGFIYSLDLTGKLLWKTEYGIEWTENWNGLHSTPTLYKDKLYVLSAFGKLVCLDAKNGKILWTVELFKDYDGVNIQWGITENLLIDDNKLYCTPGGKTANLIALNPDNGKLIWKSAGFGEASAYCSPLAIKLAKRKIIVTHTANSVIGVDALDGKPLWKYEHPNKYSVHPNTPIYSDGYLFCFSGYGRGGEMLKLSDDGSSVTEVWKNVTMDNQMGGLILHNGKLYGSGQVSRTWFCIDWKTGKELSSEKITYKGSNIIFADDMLYNYCDNGEIMLIQPLENGYKIVSSFKVPFGANQHWAHTVIKDKKLYVRHGTSLMVYSIAAK